MTKLEEIRALYDQEEHEHLHGTVSGHVSIISTSVYVKQLIEIAEEQEKRISALEVNTEVDPLGGYLE